MKKSNTGQERWKKTNWKRRRFPLGLHLWTLLAFRRHCSWSGQRPLKRQPDPVFQYRFNNHNVDQESIPKSNDSRPSGWVDGCIRRGDMSTKSLKSTKSISRALRTTKIQEMSTNRDDNFALKICTKVSKIFVISRLESYANRRHGLLWGCASFAFSMLASDLYAWRHPLPTDYILLAYESGKIPAVRRRSTKMFSYVKLRSRLKVSWKNKAKETNPIQKR